MSIPRSFQLHLLFVVAASWGGMVAKPVLCQELEYQVQRLNGIGFRFPASMELELVAGSDLIRWPIVADWDEKGRLVVLESAGVSKNVVEQNRSQPHRMVRLVDDDGDGKFDRRIIAAEKLEFPEGVLCIGNQTLVSAPPVIYSLMDSDGDGVCEERSVWFDGTTITGCANDLHGPYRGRDGWIYWCKGAFAEQKQELTSGKTLVTKAAHVFRRKLEGGPIEVVMTGGMDNPVELAITPEGERFFTSTFLQHPSGGRRDGIAHAVYGGVYGKDHHVIQGHLRTGPLMPIMTHLGPAAPSGLAFLESSRMSSDLGLDTHARVLAAAQFNLQRVTLHALEPKEATFETQNLDLLLGDRVDFHPTDVIEDADGSLLIVDTGGWYDLCCPSSGVDQEKALGGIYRLRNRLTQQASDPRGLRIDFANNAETWKSLVRDERPWVRQKAYRSIELSSQGTKFAASVLQDPQVPLALRLEALWSLCRIGSPEGTTILSSILQDPEHSLRQAALHAISVRRLPLASEVETLLVKETNPHVLRAAAEAIGRIGSETSYKSLMTAFDSTENMPVLQHSVLYAMLELNQPSEVAKYLQDVSPKKRGAAILVLDQLGSDLLKPAIAFSGLASESTYLRNVSLDALAHHPHWCVETKGDVASLGKMAANETALREGWWSIVAAWRDQEELRSVVTSMLNEAPDYPASQQAFVLETLNRMREKELPLEWTQSIERWLTRANVETQAGLANWIASLRIDATKHATLAALLAKKASENAGTPRSLLSHLAALPVGTKGIESSLQVELLRRFLDPTDENLQRSASRAVERIRWNAEQANELVEKLSQVPPLLLPTAIASVSQLGSDDLDSNMLQRLLSLPAARTLSPESIEALYRNRSVAVRQSAQQLVAKIKQPPTEITEQLNRIEAELPSGDAVRGFQVFRSPKAACSACHRVGYVGGSIGPELSRIGASRTRRDLLEAILFPSVRLAQSYQPVRVLTSDGQVYNGLVQSETDGELELIVGADKSVRIAKGEIESRKPSDVSIMPAGLDQTMSKQDLADLLQLLESKK